MKGNFTGKSVICEAGLVLHHEKGVIRVAKTRKQYYFTKTGCHMIEIRDEIKDLVEQLKLFDDNYTNSLEGRLEGRLYRENRKGKTVFYLARENEKEQGKRTFHNPSRRRINHDPEIQKLLLSNKLAELVNKHVVKDLGLLMRVVEEFEPFDLETLKGELPAAYRELPEEIFEALKTMTGGIFVKSGDGGGRAGSGQEEYCQEAGLETVTIEGIEIPKRLRDAARKGKLTSRQREEIREIQREWANRPYRQNTKNLEFRNKVTSKGLLVRSKSEVSLSEMFFHYDTPFRYDEVIVVGSRTISPDFSFLSILTGRVCWEHAGMTNKQSYIDHHRYKRGIYESIGLVPWKNYIETYDEEDGSIDMRIVEAEIRNKLLKWLFLE